MAIGPVQLVVLGFNHPNFHGEIIEELERLRETDAIRVIDALAVHKDAEGGARIHAFAVAAETGAPPDDSEIREHLAARLPSYMIPDVVVFRPELPLTPTGKLDRKALSALSALSGPSARPEAAASPEPNAASPSDPPADDLESRIAALWTQVLDIEQIGVDDSFFDRGGSSLKLIRLHARLCDSFAVDLPIQRLFEISTIRAQARFLAGTRASAAASGDAGPDVSDRAAARRATLGRRRMERN